jgi:hypothetical protein
MDKNKIKQLKTTLQTFTGTQEYFKIKPYDFVYTEGVQYLANNAECYWLLNEIGLANMFSKAVKETTFQVWKLKVNTKTKEAELFLTDDDKALIFIKKIQYTDFPLEEITLWLIDKTLILPSEY